MCRRASVSGGVKWPWPTPIAAAMPAIVRLLIVEDDKSFLQRLARAMEGRGFTVTTAESVADGLDPPRNDLARFRGRRHAARGRQWTRRRVSALKLRRPDARAIILTGYGNIATAVNAVKLGAVDYLSKPVDADDVVAALLALDGRKAEPPENPMSADRVRWEHIQRIYELCGRNVSETARRLEHAPAHLATHSGEAGAEVTSSRRLDPVVPVRVGERGEAQRRRTSEGEHHALAGGGMQPMLRRLADDRCTEGIGDDETGVAGENLARHVERGGEEQPVAMEPIVHPFLVGAEDPRPTT